MVEAKCKNCGNELALDARTCDVCTQDAGYPNVRYAESPEEIAALNERVALARDAASVRGAEDALTLLADAVGRTKAVMNRHITPLQIWLSGNNPIFRNFYNEIEAGRKVKNDRYNRHRTSAENTINPLFYKDLSIAALSLDGAGTTYYGPYTVTLKTDLISHRATVFEENPFLFNERHAIISGHDPPAGFRATWDNRALLGIAKLQPSVTPTMRTDSEFANLIMGSNRTSEDCDFIEVHIYDGVHREAIERVSGPRPADETDEIFWDDVKAKLYNLGAEVEET